MQGKDQLEDDEKMPQMETWTAQVPTVNINQERRKERPSEEEEGGQAKRRRVGDVPDVVGEGAAALGTTVKNSLQFRGEKVEEDRIFADLRLKLYDKVTTTSTSTSLGGGDTVGEETDENTVTSSGDKGEP